MKPRSFAYLLVGTHLLFIILILHKQSAMIALSFAKQRNEKALSTLESTQEHLIAQIHEIKHLAKLEYHAQNTLGMEHIKAQQIIILPEKKALQL